MRWSPTFARASVFVLSTAAGAIAAPTTQPTLREAAAAAHVWIGTAIMSRQLEDPPFANLVATQFDTLTGENEFKPDAIQHRQGIFRFDAADRIATFAREHQQHLIGHTLLWHGSNPPWMFADAQGKPLPRETALANLRGHITTVMRHFHGSVVGWDVVNEAIADGNDSGDLRDTPARRAIGDDYVEQAFRFAREADPDAKLYYNDYNIELPGKRERALRLVRSLKDAGLIDGVGIQGHWLLKSPDVAVIDDAITAFGQLGLQVNITELDIDPLPRRGAGADVSATERAADPYRDGLPADVAAEQARRYAHIFALVRKHPDVVRRVTFWGVDDGHSWLNDFPVRGRTNHPLLFDRQLQPKPAFDAVLTELQRPRP